MESINALNLFDSFDSEEKSQHISVNEETEFGMLHCFFVIVLTLRNDSIFL
jgi:hypothetical protein